MGERVSSDDLAALLFRERCFILDGLMTFSWRVADAVILRWIDIFIVSSSSRCDKPAFRFFPVFLPNLAKRSFAEKGFLQNTRAATTK